SASAVSASSYEHAPHAASQPGRSTSRQAVRGPVLPALAYPITGFGRSTGYGARASRTELQDKGDRGGQALRGEDPQTVGTATSAPRMPRRSSPSAWPARTRSRPRTRPAGP